MEQMNFLDSLPPPPVPARSVRARVSPARRSDPDTAKAAARAHKVERGSLRWRVLEALHLAGDHGLNDYEAGEKTGLLRTSAGKRRLELQELGFVEYSGRQRPTDRESPARVWRLTASGRALYLQLRDAPAKEAHEEGA